jgi:hypothetical protein
MKDLGLKPCPFCGGKADLMICINTAIGTRYFPHCTKCKCAIGKIMNDDEDDFTGSFGDKTKAVEAWNEREPATPLQEARDRGDRLGELLYQAQSVIEFYATPPPLTASGKPQRACDMQAYEVLHRLVEARAALAAEGKAP